MTEVTLDRRDRGSVVTEDLANGDGLGEVIERVDVPWALMCDTSLADTPASSSANSMQRIAP